MTNTETGYPNTAALVVARAIDGAEVTPRICFGHPPIRTEPVSIGRASADVALMTVSHQLGYRPVMANDDPSHVEALEVRNGDEPDSVVIRPNPFGAIARAAGSATALALSALVTATATMLNMSVANDLADAKLYSSRGLNNLEAIRWVAGTRLIVAGVALLLALLAGIRYSRDQPATRYTFSVDGQEATESTEGAAAPDWIRMLVGSAVVVSVLAILLNALALLLTLHLHESPNFGVPTG
jgi:hypothetical protein